MRLVLMFLCCEWIVVLHWRPGLAYAIALTIAYLPKSLLLAQFPLNPIYAAFLEASQMALVAQFIFGSVATALGGLDTLHPGTSVLNLFRKHKFTWLTLEPLVALCFASLCAASTLAGDAPVLLPYLAGQPMMYPGAWEFWEAAGPEGRMAAMLLLPFIGVFFLRLYNRRLYARTDLAFAEAAGMTGARPPSRPPAGALIAGSAIVFPKVSVASRRGHAPSIGEISRSFR